MKNQQVEKKQASKEAVSTAVVVATLEQKAKPLFNKLKKIEKIDSPKDVTVAGEQMKLLKLIGKEAEKELDNLTSDSKEALKNIRASIDKAKKFFEPFQNKIKLLDTEIKALIEAYYDRQDKAIAKIEEDFSSGKIKKIDTYTNKISEAQIVGSKMGAKRVQKLELVIEDEKKIPREYMVPDERAIEFALRDGKKVPGAILKKVNKVSI